MIDLAFEFRKQAALREAQDAFSRKANHRARVEVAFAVALAAAALIGEFVALMGWL